MQLRLGLREPPGIPRSGTPVGVLRPLTRRTGAEVLLWVREAVSM